MIRCDLCGHEVNEEEISECVQCGCGFCPACASENKEDDLCIDCGEDEEEEEEEE